MKTTIKHINSYSGAIVASIFMLLSVQLKAQIPANAINADPAVISVTQVPAGPNIVGTAVLQFRFRNAALSVNSTGQIPANSVRLTISFPGQYAFTSVNTIPKFVLEDFDDQPFGEVHLVNNQMILEGEQIDLLINVRGTQSGPGMVTFNADRTTPITVANTLTSNDNVAASFTTTGVLPVQLKNFSAMGDGCAAKLSWTTTSEIGFVKFEVMRSTDGGLNYITIASVSAAGSQSGERTYGYIDQMQGNGAHLYRLRMIDKDGGTSYSPVARINSGCQSDNNYIRVYPSPATSMITLNVADPALINTRAVVIDLAGRIVKTIMINGTATSVAVTDLKAGMYMIRLQNNTTVKFVKE